MLTGPGARDFTCINGKSSGTAGQMLNKENSELLNEMVPGRKFPLQEDFQSRLSSMDEVESAASEHEDRVCPVSIIK